MYKHKHKQNRKLMNLNNIYKIKIDNKNQINLLKHNKM